MSGGFGSHSCGCSASAPCQHAAKIFAKLTHWRSPLLQHLAAGSNLAGYGLLKVQRRRLHSWEYCRDGVALKRCRNCNLECTSGRQIGKSKGAVRYCREAGGEWTECPPLPDCLGTKSQVQQPKLKVTLSDVVSLMKAANRERAVTTPTAAESIANGDVPLGNNSAAMDTK